MRCALRLCFAVLPLCAACATSSGAKDKSKSPTAARSPVVDRLFPTPTEALSITNPEGVQKRWTSPTFEHLVAEMERITPVQFVIDVETQRELERTPVGNLQAFVVSPERVWTVFEALLIDSDFCLEVVSSEDPIVFSVSSTQPQAGRGQGGPRKRALHVPVEDLSAWSAHPAFALTTTVTLNHVNVRDLSNSLRQMFTDPQTQQVIPVGNSNSLLITGFGPAVADIVRSLQTINDAERARHEEEDKLTPEQRDRAAARTGVTPGR